MEDLIKALQIFLKYGNPTLPTHCEHNKLIISEIDPVNVSNEDKVELNMLSFNVGGENEYGENLFYSYKFGRAK